jgi:hypothetical protein
MGLLPFDDWIYNLPYKRDEVNREHQDVVNTQNTVQSRVLLFNTQLDQYKLLLTNNAVLIYIDKTVRLQDLQLKDFTTQIDALPPPVNGDVVLNGFSAATELIGGILVLKFVVNLGKIAKDALWPATEGAENVGQEVIEDMSEDALDAGIVDSTEAASTESLESVGEAVTDEVVESATSAALASTGIGIFLAVGIDAIFGAINGAKEADQLDKILSDLDDKMKIVNGFLNTVNTKSADLTQKSVDQITLFKNVATGMKDLLPPGQAPTFDFSFPATTDSLAKCLAAQQAALTQFSLLSQLRTTYVNALNNHRNPTKAAIIGAVLLSSPDWVTEDILNAIWDNVLAKYSTLMKNAT